MTYEGIKANVTQWIQISVPNSEQVEGPYWCNISVTAGNVEKKLHTQILQYLLYS